MRKLLVVVALIMLAAPVWSQDPPWTITYDGSTAPTPNPPNPWTVYNNGEKGQLDGLGAWMIVDDNVTKNQDRMRYAAGADIRPLRGATIESRIKCTAYSESSTYTGLNLGMNVYYGGEAKFANWATIKASSLTLRDHLCAPAPHYTSHPPPEQEIARDNTGYDIYRLCYKRQNLPSHIAEGSYQGTAPLFDTWALYLNGSTDPILHSWDKDTNTSPETNWSSPIWGAGGGSPTQTIYFDYVNFTDQGPCPPGMDNTVTILTDPDGGFNPWGNAFTITWETSLPTTGELHYGAETTQDGCAYETVVADTSLPTYKTIHSVTISGVSTDNQYGFYTISTTSGGKKCISLPNKVRTDFFITSGPASVVAGDRLSATITWSTSLPDTSSEVHYGTDESCSNVVVEPGGGGVTNHSVTVPLALGNYYYYYVKSSLTNHGTSQKSGIGFNTYTDLLSNGSFESGDGLHWPPWIKVPDYGNDWEPAQMQRYANGDYNLTPHSGNYFIGCIENGQNAKDGHYTYLPVTGNTIGDWYEAKVWIYTYRSWSHWLDAACQIGIDPTGGTDATAGTVVWCYNSEPGVATEEERHYFESDNSSTTGGPWKDIGVQAQAQATTVTVFLRQRCEFALDWSKRCFDDARFHQITLPDTIGEARKAGDGNPVDLKDKRVTAVWADPDPSPELQLNANFYMEEPDRPAGIRVRVAENADLPGLGDRVSVVGFMTTDTSAQPSRGAERYIQATSLAHSEETEPGPKPVGTANVKLAGGQGQPPMTDRGYGTCTVGLLTTIWGRVQDNPDSPGFPEYAPDVDPANPGYDIYGRAHMYVDDGSGVQADYDLQPNGEGGWLNIGQYVGVKVYFPFLGDYTPQVGDYVICTGISGIEASDENWTDPLGAIALIRTLSCARNQDQGTTPPPLNYGDIIVWRAY